MNKVAKLIVKKRVLILILAILLLIPSAIGYFSTFVNYDILSYLPEEVDSMKGQSYLENDFNLGSSAMLVVDDMEAKQVQKLKQDIEGIEGVQKVLWVDDVMDITVPPELLPDDFKNFFYSDTGTMLLINFSDTTASKSTFDAIDQIKQVTTKNCFLGGLAAIVQDTKNLADQEIPIYIAAAVILAIIVLALGLESTIAPFIFILGIAFPIIYNFGSNVFLGQVSYITQALAAILQLGVTMDFSIFLLHRYIEEKEKHENREDAMAAAIHATFASITGSSLTTIAGFLALCTMSLTLGRDIGIVMAKGVLLGVICTLTILPALIMFFDKPIQRFRHKTLFREAKQLPGFIAKHYKGILVCFVVLFIPFAYGQANTSVYYALDETLPKDLPSIVGTNKLKEDFNMTSTHFILVSDQLQNYQIKEISDKIEQVDGIDTVISYEKYIGGRIPGEIEPDAIKEILQNGGKKMIVANSLYKAASDEENKQIDQLNGIIKSYDSDAVIAGEGSLTKDLIDVANVDFANVNTASIIAIFVIIALCFKSISIPVLLVLAIEFAISINMGIPFFTGTTLPFIAGIVIGTIQLGATVDYAILMTNRFKEELRGGHTAKEAAQIAAQKCSVSIITSGFTFFAANIGVAIISKLDLIKSLCSLLARGAVVSMITILVVLPAILILFSRVIEKTSIGWPKSKKQNSAPTAGETPKAAKEKCFMKRSGLKALSIFTATAICMSVTLVPMASAKEAGDGYEKDETVYLMLNADGSVREQIVSSWLHNDNGIGSYTEQTDMKDVKNVKSDEQPAMSGSKLTWKLDANDVYYEGTTDKTPPVSMKISYKLDGKKIDPQALAGKDGRVEITVSFQNNVKQAKTIDGKKRDIYTPFIVAAVCDLPTDHFKNVKVSSGKVLSEGNNQVITMISVPGLRESLGSGMDALEELTGFELRDSFTITAEARAFEMEPIMGGILTDLPLDSLKEISNADQLTGALTSMKDATGQLTDGTKALSDALRTYSGKMDELLSSVSLLDSGALALDDGIRTLAGGAGQLIGGIGTLQSGVQALHTGIGSLGGGAGQLTLGAQKLQLGSADLKTGAGQLTDGIAGLYGGLGTLDTGAKDLQNGAKQVDDGAKSLAGGIGKLNTGAKDLNTGSRELYTGLAQLDAGAKELSDGVEAYTKAIGDALNGINQKLPEIENSMNAFSGGMTGSLTDIQTDLQQSSTEMQSIMAQIAALETQIDTMRQTLGDEEVKPLRDTVNTLKQQLAGHASTLQTTGSDVQKLAGTAQSFQKDFGETYQELKQTLAPLSEQLPAQSQKLCGGAKQVAGGASGLLDGAKKLSDGIGSLCQGTEDAQKGAGTLQNGTAQVYGGAQGLAAGSAQALAGAAQLQDGSRKVSAGAADLNAGANELFGGMTTLSDGVKQAAGGADALLDGVNTFAGKASPLSGGIDQLLSGAHSLKTGTAALTSGVSQLDAASGTLSEKSGELDDGMQTFKKQAVDQLDSKVSPKIDDLNEILAVKDELIDAEEHYTTYTGAADGCESKVKFILKADGIKPAQQASAEPVEESQPKAENFWDKIVHFFKDLFGME